MNVYELFPYQPPDLSALTVEDVKQWENGLRTFTPDQIVSARELQTAMQQTIMQNTVELVSAV